MLEKIIITKVLDAVREQPKTVQELAQSLDKNWRTADRYVEQISLETGLIKTKIFRAGTRGALKVVYWNALEPGKGSAYQEGLLKQIMHNKHKEDFSAFDIYQFVPEKNREICLSSKEITHYELLEESVQQILFFSGNLSLLQKKELDILEKLAKKRIPIKILTRIDVISQEKVALLMKLNLKVGWDAFQVRHCEQPVRAFIIDDSMTIMKDSLSPEHHRELKEKMYLYYILKDPEWISWLQKVFWQLWNQSIDIETRLKALKTIKK